MELLKMLHISTAGMKVQGDRLRVIAENLANASTTATTPGGEPYRRKLVTFENVLDRALGVTTVRTKGTTVDRSAFGMRHDPGHPAADDQGNVLLPNVNAMLEMADMREALRSYQANLGMIEASKTMVQRTLSILTR